MTLLNDTSLIKKTVYTPKVTVLVNSYNRCAQLQKALDSVFRQSYQNIDLLVIDDCSTDDTLVLLEEFKNKRSSFRYIINEENSGLAFSRQKGIDMAMGEYIAFLDDDDEWIDEHKLQEQISYLEKNSEYSLVATDVKYIYDNGEAEDSNLQFPSDMINHLLKRNGILYPSTICARKRDLCAAGGIDLKFPRGIDSDLYRRMAIKGFKFALIKQPTTAYRVLGGDSITQAVNSRDHLKIIKVHFYTLRKYWYLFLKNPKSFLQRLKYIIAHSVKMLIR